MQSILRVYFRFVSTPGTKTFCIRKTRSFSSSSCVARKNNGAYSNRKPLSRLTVACKISSMRKFQELSRTWNWRKFGDSSTRPLLPPLRRLRPNGSNIAWNIIPSAKTRGNSFSPLPGALTYPPLQSCAPWIIPEGNKSRWSQSRHFSLVIALHSTSSQYSPSTWRGYALLSTRLLRKRSG